VFTSAAAMLSAFDQGFSTGSSEMESPCNVVALKKA